MWIRQAGEIPFQVCFLSHSPPIEVYAEAVRPLASPFIPGVKRKAGACEIRSHTYPETGHIAQQGGQQFAIEKGASCQFRAINHRSSHWFDV